MLFGHFKLQKPNSNLALVFLILCVNIFTLVQGRKHYTVTYQSPYRELLIDYQYAQTANESVVSILDSDRKITP